MKTLFYSLFCVGIAAAGVLSYMQIGKHQAALDATTSLQQESIVVEADVAKTQKEYDAEKALLATAEENLANTRASVELKESNKRTLNRKLAGLERERSKQDEKLSQLEEEIVAIEEAFESVNLSAAEAPAYLEELQEEYDSLNGESEELAVALEERQVQLDKSVATLNELTKKDQERYKNLEQNSISSLITAVDPSWGFVVIKPHPEAVLSPDSQLMIVRGSQYIGRADINALEANRAIADIDYDSLSAGMSVQPGDRVVLLTANGR